MHPVGFGAFGWNSPKLFVEINLAPAHARHFVEALAGQQQQPNQTAEWIGQLAGCLPALTQLQIIEYAVARRTLASDAVDIDCRCWVHQQAELMRSDRPPKQLSQRAEVVEGAIDSRPRAHGLHRGDDLEWRDIDNRPLAPESHEAVERVFDFFPLGEAFALGHELLVLGICHHLRQRLVFRQLWLLLAQLRRLPLQLDARRAFGLARDVLFLDRAERCPGLAEILRALLLRFDLGVEAASDHTQPELRLRPRLSEGEGGTVGNLD